MAKIKVFEDEELEALLKEVNTPITTKAVDDKDSSIKEIKKSIIVETNGKPALLDKAFGVNKNKDGKWEVVEILYDSTSNYCRIEGILRTEASRGVAQSKATEALARTLHGLTLNGMNKIKREKV